MPASSARLGFGLAAVGRPAYITTDRDDDLGDPADRSIAALRARAHALLDEAWDLGIRYLDAARSYGLAEEFLGGWLSAHPERRSELVIGSKWGYAYVGEWKMDATVHERKEHSAAMLDRQWPETLAALGSPPDFYLIHSVTHDSSALADIEVLQRMRRLRAEGVRVGLSTSGPRQADVVRAAMRLSDSPFTVVQSTWNLFESSAGDALLEAHDAGWTVVVKEALANGELASAVPGGDLVPAASGTAPDLFALGAALAQPFADIVLSGATTVAHLRRGVEARAVDLDRAVLAQLAVEPSDYWRRRSERPWR
ncbi:aryl-alcohol dehydrogenase-like predicted oxidoreductase [Microbacterium proteolyticum]|uniref:Aryl-alcohol dehydrogenase-like predicted oxidoreductase n=1 Tax=Microbacterium proteolyticum TaxID=1572644 RepID=A0A7W5GHF2_9MICO|nr:aldo/keto reductase [Microbacterium proteolyticum]MBB3159207.1 aryl-alcohol dehydrogenase-like predicted oxidoreductase [Microbacterium proteolyticum]